MPQKPPAGAAQPKRPRRQYQRVARLCRNIFCYRARPIYAFARSAAQGAPAINDGDFWRCRAGHFQDFADAGHQLKFYFHALLRYRRLPWAVLRAECALSSVNDFSCAKLHMITMSMRRRRYTMPGFSRACHGHAHNDHLYLMPRHDGRHNSIIDAHMMFSFQLTSA